MENGPGINAMPGPFFVGTNGDRSALGLKAEDTTPSLSFVGRFAACGVGVAFRLDGSPELFEACLLAREAGPFEADVDLGSPHGVVEFVVQSLDCFDEVFWSGREGCPVGRHRQF